MTTNLDDLRDLAVQHPDNTGLDGGTLLALLDRLEQAEAIVSQLTPTHLKMIRRALDGEA